MTEEINNLLQKQPLLLFDGECGFCNKSVQFFLKREKNKSVYFIPLQSETGMALRNYFEIGKETDSIIFISNNKAFIKSSAALRLTKYMKGVYPLLQVFLIVPPFIRNVVYDFIAKRRMRWFGRVENCALLKEEDKSRFLI
ncbi:MAG: DUF393 domain-containing protein [Bacteroidetes bacterium]|nr:DUF393 domain-containing protein [Bacteroidota bacterium]